MIRSRALYIVVRLPILLALLSRAALADPPAGATPINGGCGPGGNCVVKSLRVKAGGAAGAVPPAGTVRVGDGTTAAPSVAFISSPTYGMYKCSGGLCFSVGGAQNLNLNAVNATASFAGPLLSSDGSATLPSYAFSNEPSLGLYRDGAALLGFASGGARAFEMTQNGVMYGTTNTSSLTLNNSLGAQLLYSGSSLTCDSNRCRAQNGSTGGAAFLVNATVGQTGDLQDWQINGGSNLASIAVDGSIATAGTVTVGVDPTVGAQSTTIGGSQWVTKQAEPDWGLFKREYFAFPSLTSDATFTVIGGPAINVLAGAAGASAPGTIDTARNMISYTSAVNAADLGINFPVTGAFAGMKLRACATVQIDSITNTRVFVGFTSATPMATDNDSTLRYALARFSTAAADTKWTLCTANAGGGAAHTEVAGSTTTVAANTTYNLCVDCYAGSRCNLLVNGTQEATTTSNVPTGTTGVGAWVGARNLTATSHRWAISSVSQTENN